ARPAVAVAQTSRGPAVARRAASVPNVFGVAPDWSPAAPGADRPPTGRQWGGRRPGAPARRCPTPPPGAAPRAPRLRAPLRGARRRPANRALARSRRVPGRARAGVSEVEAEGNTLRCVVCGSFQPLLEALRGAEVLNITT